MLMEHRKCNASSRNPQAATTKALLNVSILHNSRAPGREHLDGILYEATQALAAGAANNQGRDGKQLQLREVATYHSRLQSIQAACPPAPSSPARARPSMHIGVQSSIFKLVKGTRLAASAVEPRARSVKHAHSHFQTKTKPKILFPCQGKKTCSKSIYIVPENTSESG